MSTYAEFLSNKRILATPCGFEVPESEINPMLFPFQRDIVRWALARGKAAVFAHTGLGKGPIQLEWCRHVSLRTGGNTLILAPLAVSQQFQREAAKFGVPVHLCRDQWEVQPGINITNYERLDGFSLASFAGVALDESSCFASGTPVQCLMLDNSLSMRHIEDIRPGDLILNASGKDIVTFTHRRRVKSAVAVTTHRGRVISSPDHRYFTAHGWIQAKDLRPGDFVVETASAVSCLRAGVHPKVRLPVEQEVLRNILLSEMAHGEGWLQGVDLYSGATSQSDLRDQGMVGIGVGNSGKEQGEDSTAEPYQRSSGTKEDIAEPTEYGAWPQASRGQWAGDDRIAGYSTGGTREWMGAGIFGIARQEDSRISDSVQTGHRQCLAEDRDRSGRELPLCEEGARREESSEIVFVGVDGVEVLEQGHPELEQFRAADGNIYFHDLTALRHPSFSVGGILVHNCIKDWTGKTTQRLIEGLSATPFKLCSTATPSPNDHAELGTHAELLDVMRRSAMLAMFFEHDGGETSKWSLKGHGKKPFFRFVASWAVCLKTPDDLGYPEDAAKFVLPPLRMFEHSVPVDHSVNTDGMLFRCPDLSATGLHKELRLTCDARARKVAELVMDKPCEQWIIWCNTNYEAEAMRKALPGVFEVRGSDSQEKKERAIVNFLDGKIKWLLSKVGIFGYGLNLQQCQNEAFMGLSYSFEDLFQGIRRCWRFGQTKQVYAHLVIAETEGAVLSSIRRKEAQYEELQAEMNQAMREEQLAARHKATRYNHEMIMEVPTWLQSQRV